MKIEKTKDRNYYNIFLYNGIRLFIDIYLPINRRLNFGTVEVSDNDYIIDVNSTDILKGFNPEKFYGSNDDKILLHFLKMRYINREEYLQLLLMVK